MKKANWKEPGTTAENEVLPGWFPLAWTARGTSVTLNVLLIGYITYYATDMLGMTAGLIGTLILFSKLFDGVTDLIVGFIVDKTHTKLGKARPYELFIILMWFFTILMYSTPNWSATAQAAWVFITYVMINAVCNTFLGGIDAVYMARAIRNEGNRVRVMSVSGAIGMVAAVIFSIGFPQMMATLGATKGGWTTIALIFGVPGALIGLLRFLLIPEVVTDGELPKGGEVDAGTNAENKVSFSTMLKCVMQNKFIFIIAILNFITFIISGLNTTTATYYFKYIVGDVGLMSLTGMASLTTPILLIFFPLLTRKFGTTKIMRVATLLGVIGLFIRTLGGTNMVTLMIGCIIASVASIPLTVMINAYLIDCMDYGEWKTGIRVEGLLNSISNFMAKIGSGVAAGGIGIIMDMAGYDGSLEMQSATASSAIIGVYNILPMILYAIMFVLSMIYTLDKLLPKIHEDLEKKRAMQAQ